ncbi:MAG: OsmC family protein, partial [Candidatus Dormibacteraeota bacterium]|nr:OsmC family protein [Candidatus Dormibacteraeota bacterium]
MAKATARWSGSKTRFSIEAGSGHQALVDEAAPLSDDQGMRPTEMLLGALGGCTGVNAALLLKKFQQRFQNLAVLVVLPGYVADKRGHWSLVFELGVGAVMVVVGEPERQGLYSLLVGEV